MSSSPRRSLIIHFNLPIVVNRKTDATTATRDFYIGRGSPLGNPYTHLPASVQTRGHFRVGSRREAIESYALDLVRDPARLSIIARMYGNVDRLICYCKPQACHGDVIVAIMARIAHKQHTDFASRAVQNDLLAHLRETLPFFAQEHDEEVKQPTLFS